MNEEEARKYIYIYIVVFFYDPPHLLFSHLCTVRDFS